MGPENEKARHATVPKRRSLGWILPAIGLTITTAFAIALIVLNTTKWRSSEEFSDSVLKHRSTIAIAVQIISQALGLVQVHVLSYVNTSSLRVSLPKHASTLDTVRLVASMSTPSIAWNSRWDHWLASVLYLGFSFLPAALWAGAITPTIAEMQTYRTIRIPTFQNPENLSAMWDAGDTSAQRVSGAGTSYMWLTNQGLFTYELQVSTLRGTFLEIASTASNTTKPDTPRRKFDQTGFHYLNRTYGVGAAAGLIDIPNTLHPDWYAYEETGFYTNVTCTHNESSALDIWYTFNNDEISVHTFYANGSFADGTEYYTKYPQQAPWRQDIFVWGVGYNNATHRSYISMAVDTNTTTNDWDFKQLDKLQCEIAYQARNFAVRVNNTAQTISVTAKGEEEWPDYADTVLKRTNFLSRYSSEESMFFGSLLGHSIIMNINELRLISNTSHSNSSNSSDTYTFQGLEDHLVSLFDNSLGMLSATRLMGGGKTEPVEATVGLPAVTYGERKYIIAVLVINTIILVVFVVGAIWTRLWEDMAKMELDDVGSVITCASQGGTALAEKLGQVPSGQAGRMRIGIQTVHPSGREALVTDEDWDGDHGPESEARLLRKEEAGPRSSITV